ncbi:alpha/beta hydrolase [Streptomyces lydicus]|uniref:Alpha/beta hydrolase n=1 Tax=Streptomyces lydicus TaxID=47763 RepID=A0A1D7VLA2_9ACTN|nr:alpha/beta hydrolase [Streptomyces lydicus]AOP47544.1 alpha/beta hydrolase [Streptomyces lydicus]
MRISGPIAVRRNRAAVIAVALSCYVALTGPGLGTADAPPAPAVPAPAPDWRPCPRDGHFDCATAKVPLDYGDPRGRTLDLAVVRHKATRPGRRIGTLFFNPGGPGGPGTVQMPQNYPLFPREVRERFDIVSWDPRGVGHSTAVNCFATPKESAAWLAARPSGFPVGARQRNIWIAAYRDLGRRCAQRDAALLRHVSTADSARDLDRLRRWVGDPKLTYLGASYGTILGATYANLFPGRVRALVLDSNIAPSAWTNHGDDAARLPTFLRLGSDRSAAATLDQFLTLCGSTTTAGCAFSAGGPDATRDKFNGLMRRLRERPAGTWTYARTVADTINGLYVVRPGWSEVAALLQRLWQGRTPGPSAPLPTPPVPVPYTGEEQAAAILCGDSPNPRDPGVFHPLEEAGAARAGDAGRYWTWASEPCATWPTVAADRYTGPWNRPTAATVLVVGTLYDPATPYRDAQAMAEELAHARLLTNIGYGHTALVNPSGCVNAYESRYLIDGTLPPPGTTCRQDDPPFPPRRPRGGVDAGGGGAAGLVPNRPWRSGPSTR